MEYWAEMTSDDLAAEYNIRARHPLGIEVFRDVYSKMISLLAQQTSSAYRVVPYNDHTRTYWCRIAPVPAVWFDAHFPRRYLGTEYFTQRGLVTITTDLWGAAPLWPALSQEEAVRVMVPWSSIDEALVQAIRRADRLELDECPVVLAVVHPSRWRKMRQAALAGTDPDTDTDPATDPATDTAASGTSTVRR